MTKNILIIDDSALMRRMLSDIIKKDSRLHVADIAKNGEMALDIVKKNKEKFDVILLDYFMPDMNGDELLQEINKLNIKAKIVLISGVIKEDAMEIIHALENGAFDFVTKPNNFILGKENHFQKKLLQCIELATTVLEEEARTNKQFCGRIQQKQEQSISINTYKKQEKKKGSVRGEKLVALACSTGGPKALHQVVPKLPKNLDAPMIIVQHMPKGFTNSLAIRLNEMSEINVKEAEHGEVLEKGTVYIARGGSQLRVTKNSMGRYMLQVTEEAARNGLKPCADIMYESLVGSDYDEIVCVVLTGMGGDGTAGIKQLNTKNNIYSIAQNAETCTVYGMPKVFYESGLTNEVLPLQNIADAIWKHVGVR